MHITINVPAAWLPAFDIPAHEEGAKKIVEAAVKEALLLALESRLAPEVMPLLADEKTGAVTQGVMIRMTISLPSAASATLSGFAQRCGITAGPMAKRFLGLIASGVLSLKASRAVAEQVDPKHPLSVLNLQMGRAARPEQVALYDAVWESLAGAKVGIVEGGTGIGKTLAMVAAAARWVHERQTNAGICAPTIALLRQFAAEYRNQQNVADMPPLRMIIGRREYASESELRDFLAGRGREWDSPALQSWLAHGYQVDDDDEHCADHAWQLHDLEQIAPGLPLDEVRLGDYASLGDRGYLAYKAQFARVQSMAMGQDMPMPPAILLFTHAMLAQDMRRKLQVAGQDEDYKLIRAAYFDTLRSLKGVKKVDLPNEVAALQAQLGVAMLDAVEDGSILPKFTALLVDEGHLLEESFSNALSDYVSMRGLIADLRSFKAEGGKLTTEVLANADGCVNDLVKAGGSTDKQDYVALSRSGMSAAISALSRLATICASISNVRDAQSERFRLSVKIRRAGALLALAVGKASERSYMRYSPIRRFPQLYIGRNSADDLLSHLWSSLEAAAVISATLYLQTNNGPSAKFIASLLCIPDFKAASFAPIHARWSVASVQGVWLPQSCPDWLMPPSMNGIQQDKRTPEDQSAREAIWHADLAQAVKRIWQDAAGGVMVLCTSYNTVAAVAAILLKDDPQWAGRDLLCANKNLPLRAQVQKFTQLSGEGVRPLWLAVGAAWTGVDIGGHAPWAELFGEELPPSQDNVLTDLVIPRLPFGTNQSLTHLWRVRNRPNVPWDLLDAAFRFKQALGRLVRRAGLPANRRIFVLDGRVADPLQVARLAPFTNHLARYAKKTLMR